ncbi:hypothetical protein EX895_002208 [Sporisorium graminicola]|uniref:Proline-rich protein PRCC n=1 Tax=Sporisorium graminicola TaxID=280036 RepID=A0A4U7KXI8_9BASI|nr:hypothetical protein EX895_002208 [Sporisorium graminicola]TKY88967.1 hypothetical protein EX895_002208 [Sporisorium graminicola]
MASGLASLAGYGSDSDEEGAAHAVASTSSHVAPSAPAAPPPRPSSSKLGALLPPPRAGLESKLPPPSSSASGSGIFLPPPTSTTSSKRKVIKVDSLQSFQASDDGNDPDEADSKKPRLGSNLQKGSASKHSLFGMLPAPKRKDDEVLAERNKQAQARREAKAIQDAEASTSTQTPLSINEAVLRATSPTDNQPNLKDADEADLAAAVSKPKGKSNDAFRAMLGLKPSATKPQVPPATSASSSTSTGIKPDTTTQNLSSKTPSHPSTTILNVAPGPGRTAPSKLEAKDSIDFFSLASNHPFNNNTASAPQSSSFVISSAPTIERPGSSSSHPNASIDDDVDDDDSAEYPGWQLDPDGSWVPVTPEAHAQLLAYQQSLSRSTPSTTPTSKSTSNLDGTRDLLAAGLTPEDIRAFDASTAARQAYLDPNGDAADNDKYAAAAEFAAGNREVQQRKPGMLKGLRKGQLSSLVSLAGENRSQLEKRWQRNREAKAQRSTRYGF